MSEHECEPEEMRFCPQCAGSCPNCADRDELLRPAADRLEALLPELEYSRQTHVDWRDCEQSYRDRNPHIGNKEFHAQCVRDYDERIAAIKEAAALLRSESNDDT